MPGRRDVRHAFDTSHLARRFWHRVDLGNGQGCRCWCCRCWDCRGERDVIAVARFVDSHQRIGRCGNPWRRSCGCPTTICRRGSPAVPTIEAPQPSTRVIDRQGGGAVAVPIPQKGDASVATDSPRIDLVAVEDLNGVPLSIHGFVAAITIDVGNADKAADGSLVKVSRAWWLRSRGRWRAWAFTCLKPKTRADDQGGEQHHNTDQSSVGPAARRRFWRWFTRSVGTGHREGTCWVWSLSGRSWLHRDLAGSSVQPGCGVWPSVESETGNEVRGIPRRPCAGQIQEIADLRCEVGQRGVGPVDEQVRNIEERGDIVSIGGIGSIGVIAWSVGRWDGRLD